MCVYVSNSTAYDTCLAYSNYVCELLILRLHKPALIIILLYCPPTCSPEDFNDIISRSRAINLAMSSPLPNIIMLGDFNFPDINWLNRDYNCHDASPLILCSDLLFLIPISSLPCQTMNSACNTFELLDFRKADWLGLCACIKSVNWKELLYDCIPSKYTTVIIETLGNLCSIYVFAKHSKNNFVSKFHRARKILMRKRSKLEKIYPLSPSIQSKLAIIERDLISSRLFVCFVGLFHIGNWNFWLVMA